MEVHARARQAARRPSPLGGGIKKNSWGDYVTGIDGNFLFNTPFARNAMNTIYPGVSFGSSNGKLTINANSKLNDKLAQSAIDDLKAMRETTTKAFTAEPGGVWEFESKCGYGQILDATSYDGVRKYEMTAWGPNPDMGNTQMTFSDLNTAKKSCRDYILFHFGDQNRGKR